jgi:hypothetical protein
MITFLLELLRLLLSRLETSSAPVSRWFHAGFNRPGRRPYGRYGDVKGRKGSRAADTMGGSPHCRRQPAWGRGIARSVGGERRGNDADSTKNQWRASAFRPTLTHAAGQRTSVLRCLRNGARSILRSGPRRGILRHGDALGGRWVWRPEDLGVEDSGHLLDAIHKARPRSTVVGRRVDCPHRARAHCGRLLPALKKWCARRLLLDRLDVEPAGR